jgi:hypothetical protein
MARDVFMVLAVEASGSVMVKTLDFFRSQKGFTEEWGRNWRPVMAVSIESARYIGCCLYRTVARPFDRQAYAELSHADIDWLQSPDCTYPEVKGLHNTRVAPEVR